VPATFNVQYRPVGGGTWTTFSGIVNNALAVSGLSDCTEYEFQVEADCDSLTSGGSQSFTWTSEGCCTAPINLNAAATDAVSATVDWSTVLAAGTYDLRFTVSGTTNWTTLTGLTGTSTVLTGLDSCTTYEVQMTSSCSGNPAPWGTTVTFSTPGCGACIDNSFCASAGDNANSEWIANVTVGAIANTSGSDDGYGDFTGNSATFLLGQAYPISLTPGFSGFSYTEWFRVYIDMDHDGQFPASDLVFDPGGLSTTTVTGQLTVPTTALLGDTRMRVVMKYNGAPVNGCEDGYDYGETEDYCVTLTGSVGVNELGDALVSVYPNPADQQLFLEITGAFGPASLSVDVLDNSGRLVMSRTIQHGRSTLPTATLAEGLYTYVVKGEGTREARGRFIVLHSGR
jgi:hypothetical protein